jgi:hypothetical protein
MVFLRDTVYCLDNRLAFDPSLYPYDYRKVISSYRPKGHSKETGISGEGGRGYRVLRAETRAKMERNSSCFRPSGRAACNRSDEDPAAAGRGPQWTSPHTLSIPIVHRWKGILRKRPAPPAGEGKKSLATVAGQSNCGTGLVLGVQPPGMECGTLRGCGFRVAKPWGLPEGRAFMGINAALFLR